MLFDVKAALAEILDAGAAIPAISAISRDETAAKSQESRQSQPPQANLPVLAVNRAADLPEPASTDGYCHTWRGRVVRLDEWRRLSEWDRHGPGGRLFCGICREWTSLEEACGRADCWHATTLHSTNSRTSA